MINYIVSLDSDTYIIECTDIFGYNIVYLSIICLIQFKCEVKYVQ